MSSNFYIESLRHAKMPHGCRPGSVHHRHAQRGRRASAAWGPNYLADTSGPLNFHLPHIFVTGALAFCWIAVHSSDRSHRLLGGVWLLSRRRWSRSLEPVTVEISRDTSERDWDTTWNGVGLLVGSPRCRSAFDEPRLDRPAGLGGIFGHGIGDLLAWCEGLEIWMQG